MFDIRIVIYLVATLVISLFIIIAKPDLHKQAIITDSAYDFAEIIIPQSELKPAAVPVTVSSVPPQNQNVSVSNTNTSNKPVKTTSRPANYSNQNAQNKNTNKQSQPVKTAQNKNVQTNSTSKKTVESKPQNQQKQTQQQEKQQTAPKQVKVTQENPIQNTHKPVLTEQEEIIAWNRWRSRLQNQTMMDTKLAAPLGTQFKFSFTVDKYGNLSNVKVWSTNPAYSDMAVRAIKPVLMSYRNKPILNFPEGTKRIITNVTGGFIISRTTEYSTPDDYNDYERVKH